MNVRLPQGKWENLVNIWTSGFCMTTIEHADRTWDQPNASEGRIQFIKDHIEKDKCSDCALAMQLKDMEQQIAVELGPEAMGVFTRGGNIVNLPGARKLRETKVVEFLRTLPPEGKKAWSKWAEVVGKRPPLETVFDPEGGLVPFRLPDIATKRKEAKFLRGRDLVVELYLSALAEFRHISESKSAHEDARIRSRQAWAVLQQAHIFEIPAGLYSAFYQLADRLTTTKCGWDYNEPVDLTDDSRAVKYTQTIKKEATGLWPEHFPFDTCYLALDPPVELSDVQRIAYKLGHWGSDVGTAWMCGFLVTAKGMVLALINAVHAKADIATIVPLAEKGVDEDWLVPGSLTPWIVTWFVDWINDHQVTIEERTRSFGYRDHYKKATKRMKMQHIPAPYYVITMREDLLREKERNVLAAPHRHWELQYRHDVRGCTNCRIMRGPLPLDPKLEKQLRRDKRRKIYTDQQPDSETAKELAKRGVAPKRRDEWLSVLLFWRKDHVKGPKDAPFIPAIRRSARRRTGSD